MYGHFLVIMMMGLLLVGMMSFNSQEEQIDISINKTRNILGKKTEKDEMQELRYVELCSDTVLMQIIRKE